MNRRGMTLVEILVALIVFSLVAAAAAASLRLAADARDQLVAADRRIATFQTSRIIIKEDLASAVPRRTRDEFGDVFGPAFLGGSETRIRPPVAGETLLLAFVRSGWVNPEMAAPRSSLQFVEYVVRGKQMIRKSRPYLDDARGQARMERVLFEDVEGVEIEFLPRNGAASVAGAWSSGWPMERNSDRPPRAVAVSFSTPRTGALRQIFWIGDLGGRPQENAAAPAAGETTPKADDGAAPPAESTPAAQP